MRKRSMSDDRRNVVDMDGSRVDDDHLLSMYLDGELDTVRARQLSERIKAEPALKSRLAAMQENDRLLSKLFRSDAAEVPKAITAMVRSNNVVRLRAPLAWRTWSNVAVAASVALAAALLVNLNQTQSFNPMAMDDRLAHALDTSASKASGWEALDAERSFRSVLTFPATDGRWCREFLVAHDESHWRGVSCRDNGQWINQVVGSEVFLEQETQYRPAGSGDSNKVARFIDETAADVALGPQQEAALIASGW